MYVGILAHLCCSSMPSPHNTFVSLENHLPSPHPFAQLAILKTALEHNIVFGLLKRLPTSGASHAEGPRDEVDEMLKENHSILLFSPQPSSWEAEVCDEFDWIIADSLCSFRGSRTWQIVFPGKPSRVQAVSCSS